MKRSSIFWGLVLVASAGLLLLKNLGVIDDFFSYFWIFALMLVGTWLIIISLSPAAKEKGEQIKVALENATSVHLKLDHGAGQLKLASGAGIGLFLEGKSTPGSVIKSVTEGDLLKVRMKAIPDFWMWAPGESHNWDLVLNPEIPISLDIDSGASSAILDLHDLKVIVLDLDTGASTSEITLPSNAGFTRVKIDSGAATLRIHIPEGVAAQIHIESGMTSIHVNERFSRVGTNSYLSPDFATATNRVEIRIETGMASVDID